MDEQNLSGKVALVTGSTSGIRRGIALELARQEAYVLATGYRHQRIQETIRMIWEMGEDARGCPLGVTDKNETFRLFNTFVKETGIGIFVSNAGITTVRDFLENTPDEIESICRTNLLGAVYCTQQAARLMTDQKRGGAIIMITPCNTHAPLPGQSFYSAIKCALEGLIKGTAWELAPYRIRINAVAPGAVVSELTGIKTEEEQTAARKGIPIPRMGQPGEIGKTVCFLASDDASCITGTSLLVDGGVILRNAQ